MTRAAELIKQLGLKPHPEGGHYREIFRSAQRVSLPSSAGTSPVSARSALTQIYFLLRAGELSRWHVVSSDEAWHFYEGDPLHLLTYDPKTQRRQRVVLGTLASGCSPFTVVPAHVWQAAQPTGAYSLLGCGVAPGFEFADFQLVSDLERKPDPFEAELKADSVLL